jgi:enoyl-CoA hydratase/carnithine racemase
MDLKATHYDIADRVATITLARPQRLNAWTGRMHTEYRWSLQQAETDPDVRVVVVTGEGRGFCAGADAAALEGHVDRGGYDPGTPADLANPGFGVRPEFDHDFAFHFGLTKPVIAAINGPAAGVGLVLACFADIRFAAAGAKLTTSAPRLGLPAEYGLSWILPRLVGVTHSADILLTGRVILAEEMADWGFFNAVVPRADFDAKVAFYAGLLARVSPDSVTTAKRQLWGDLLHDDPRAAVEDSKALIDRMMQLPDYVEGVAAMRERRAPRFTGNR